MSVRCQLSDDDLLAVADVEALLRGLAVEAAAVEVVPWCDGVVGSRFFTENLNADGPIGVTSTSSFCVPSTPPIH